MDSNPTIRFTVPPEEDGQPLVGLVAAALGDDAAAALLIARGGLWVDGVRVRDPVPQARAAMEVALQRPSSGVYPEVTMTAAQILYEDEDLLALNKPPGVYVDSTPWDA